MDRIFNKLAICVESLGMDPVLVPVSDKFVCVTDSGLLMIDKLAIKNEFFPGYYLSSLDMKFVFVDNWCYDTWFVNVRCDDTCVDLEVI